MELEIEKVIDDVWDYLLNKIRKREVSQTRTYLGDDIDLGVPQARILLLLASNPALSSLMYLSAYASTRRNAYIMMRKLGMPADYFWKFEYWPKERAFGTLQKLLDRVFSAMMSQIKEGQLELADIDVEQMRFQLRFKNCAECAGVHVGQRICFYHAGVFAGIISALINKELDGFELECCAQGDDSCLFLIGNRDDEEIEKSLSDYLGGVEVKPEVEERLKQSLQDLPVRSLGNLVDIGYHQLIVANSLGSDPKLISSTSFETGCEYGKRLAPIIADFYQQGDQEAIAKYYRQVRELKIEVARGETGLNMRITDCAEVAGGLQNKDMLAFLLGELQGLASGLLQEEVVYQECHFEGDSLVIGFLPQV
jgi:predicted hydrocarbon binding protein